MSRGHKCGRCDDPTKDWNGTTVEDVLSVRAFICGCAACGATYAFFAVTSLPAPTQYVGEIVGALLAGGSYFLPLSEFPSQAPDESKVK